MNLTAALDLGTTTIRVGIFAPDGTRVAICRDRLDLAVPFSGAAEQDPDEYVASFHRLWARVVAEAQVHAGPVAITSLGITNQRSTVVAWDAATGRPLGPAVGWQDTRTAAQVKEFVANGIPLNTSASCTKMQWLLENDPMVGAAAVDETLRFGTVDSWMTWVLSGGAVHATDPTNAAATGLYDARSGDWSSGALDLFGIDRATLATIVASDADVGPCIAADAEPVADVARPAGIEGVRLAARIGDQMAACVAHDLSVGEAKLSLGTSAMLDVAVDGPTDPAPAGCYALPMWRRAGGDAYMVEGSINAAGSAVEWLVRVGLLERVEDLDRVAAGGGLAAGSGEGAEVEFVPALAGLGSPQQDPSARGAWTGLGLDTTGEDLVRAVVDGIAARVAELAAHMGVAAGNGAATKLRLDGGLSQSVLLCDAIGARTGLEVVVSDDPEAALRGAATLAGELPLGTWSAG